MIHYFKNEIDYPNYIDGEILPFNVLYSEVPTSFLDAFINACKNHVLCYTLDYYRNNDLDKQRYVERINNNGLKRVNTSLSEIQDDLVIISSINEPDKYTLFWYHLSGRCDIGRFSTQDTINNIENQLVKWMMQMKSDEIISGYSKINQKVMTSNYNVLTIQSDNKYQVGDTFKTQSPKAKIRKFDGLEIKAISYSFGVNLHFDWDEWQNNIPKPLVLKDQEIVQHFF